MGDLTDLCGCFCIQEERSDVVGQVCVSGMLDLKDSSTFKQHLRDFLVQSKSFVDKDNQELFAEEAAARQAVSPRFLPSGVDLGRLVVHCDTTLLPLIFNLNLEGQVSRAEHVRYNVIVMWGSTFSCCSA